ncbi:DivIVA domain-containing protein [Spirosoma spitsbergense]|uniref:DivIVA domain-containing protein n=1 Tax=Spirosoma spitsbergense TaxID=431554 RepID=UPI00037FC08C|nr:DivIVA domain-containing protein [Spirosoma spitsbergense]
MKITPIEIRQHTFEKGLRGYKAEDVDAFLVSLSQEWERVTNDHKMLKMQLELAEKELGKLKEFEMTLFRTLKTAEDSSAQITEQANKVSEGHINEAKQKADEILADARKRTALMVKDAENQSRFLKDNILNDLKSLEHDFKALEGYKENLAVQIRALASNAMDSVDRFEKKFAKQNLKGKIDEVTTQIEEDRNKENEPIEIDAPAGNSPEPEQPTSNAIDLPELTDRSEAVPEAIPADEDMTNKLEESVHIAEQELVEPITKEAPVEEQTVPEPTPVNEEVVEEAKPKKGGSFFDQI